ncbi:MAG: ABC-type polysaccharide/polyol phosphate export system, permease component [Acidobacteria bacterium]|nr:ABC-type polysaccharide/polyol phosphate export system, permease component [Acidobacteriota bacterium]
MAPPMSAVDSAKPPDSAKPVVEISPSRGWQALDLIELWHFRELLHIFVWRDLKVRYRQTVLGVIWIVAQPLITMLIFTLLFNRVARIQPDSNVPYSIFVMTALVPWTFFSAAVAASGNSLIGSAHLISKVYFPRMIVLAATIVAAAVDMLVTLGVVAVMLAWYRVPVSWSILAMPVIIVVCAIQALGVGLWLSALNVEYRDLRVVIPFVMQFWLYATPVVYPIGALPPRYRLFAQLNPLTGVVDGFRASLTGRPIDWIALGYATVVGLVVLIGGMYYFRRMERQFADVL